MTRLLRKSLFMLLKLLWVMPVLLIPWRQAVSITASPDRYQLTMGETFNLSIEVEGMNIFGSPDFSALEQNFTVLSNSRSSNLRSINGQTQSSTVWNLRLSPRRSGHLNIPAISFNGEATQAFSIKVTQPQVSELGDGGPLAIQVELSPSQQVYQQSQLSLTVRIFIDVRLRMRQHSLETPEFPDARLEKTGDTVQYQTSRNGQQYQVLQQGYLLFPQTSGLLKIPSFVYSGNQGGFFNSGRSYTKASAASTIEVLPRPATFQGQWWLPATELTLTQSFSPNPPEFRVGQPVTRTLTLTALGQSGENLPEINIAHLENIKSYAEQAHINSEVQKGHMLGQRIEKIALIPTKEGPFTLPEISLNWWDVNSNAQKQVSVPALSINVLPAIVEQLPKPDPNLVPAKPIPSPVPGSASNGSEYWPWATAFAALAWLTTLLLWLSARSQSKGNKPNKQAAEQQESFKQAQKKVKQACDQNNADAIKQALLSWARLKWPNNPPLSLGKLAENAGGDLGGSQLSGCVKQLEQTLYSTQYSTRQDANNQHSFAASNALKQAFYAFEKKQRQQHSNKGQTSGQNELPPLYPS